MGTESERMADEYDKTSPWPIVVVLGLVCSEIGLLFGVYPVAVAGLVMFVGSVSGIVHEAGYVLSPWRLLVGLGGALAVLGLVIVSLRADGGASAFEAAAADALLRRGITMAATGGALAAAGIVLPRALDR